DGPTAFALSAALEHLTVHLTCLRRLNQRGYRLDALTATVTDTEVVRWLLSHARLDPESLHAEIRAHHFGGSAEFLAARGVKLPASLAEARSIPELPTRLRARLDRLESQVCAPLRAAFPDADVAVDLARLEGLTYYDGLALRVTATSARGERFPLADGGSLDWMSRLLGDGKERMLASGFGPDLIASRFTP
ncbi:MAG TPA: ATP phosphoribosyltransferase regulatory subunit, partial [Myxococcaceae bacterium]|nr:ATP phosphoribosyltransferase regulatory subunit [Myxococcaceae bacterium]